MQGQRRRVIGGLPRLDRGEETLEDRLAWHPYRACNQYRYLADVEHNTAVWVLVWVLVWVFVAASVAAIVYAAVLMPPS